MNDCVVWWPVVVSYSLWNLTHTHSQQELGSWVSRLIVGPAAILAKGKTRILKAVVGL